MGRYEANEAQFEALGPRTGIYLPLFGGDDYQMYGREAMARLRGVADETIVVHDGSVGNGIAAERLLVEGEPNLGKYFQAAIDCFAERGVGAFFYANADDIADVAVVSRMLRAGVESYDIVYTNLQQTDTRDVSGVPGNPWGSFFAQIPWHFHSTPWPETSVYRTSIFREHPVDTRDGRRFIPGSLQRAVRAGKRFCVVNDDQLAPDGKSGMWYFQHSSQLTRENLERAFH